MPASLIGLELLTLGIVMLANGEDFRRLATRVDSSPRPLETATPPLARRAFPAIARTHQHMENVVDLICDNTMLKMEEIEFVEARIANPSPRAAQQ